MTLRGWLIANAESSTWDKVNHRESHGAEEIATV
jgi:hypothetical protein